MTKVGKDRSKNHTYIALQGGLGNQLFQLCAGLKISNATDREVKFFKSFLTLPNTVHRSMELQELLTVHERSNLRSLISSPLVLAGPKLGHKIVDHFDTDFNPMHLRPKFAIVKGWFHSYDLVAGVHSALIERLKISPSFSPLIQNNQINAIGIHLRLGDDKSVKSRSFHGATALGYFDEAISNLIKEFKQFEKVIFVTDHSNRAQDVVKGLKISQMSIPIEIISSTPIRDLSILSSCKGIVASNSSYSWWAAYLGATLRGAKVVWPKPFLALPSIYDESLKVPNWKTIQRQVL